MADKLDFLEKLSVLELKDGDTLVITTPHALPAQAVEHIKNTVRYVMGSETRVLVLPDGMQAAVLREAA